MKDTRPPTRSEQLDALFACPLIHDLSNSIGALSHRTRRHPLALHLAWSAMARLYRSANRLDAELSHRPTWQAIVERYNNGAANHPTGTEVRSTVPPLLADTYRHVRTHLTAGDTLDTLLEGFTRHSIALARHTGLLDPNGPGSRTRPHPSRVVYGDGTIIRPIYNPARSSSRQDPTIALHGRFDGTHWGNNLVTLAARGPAKHHRLILAVGRVHAPGHEAATAVELLRRVHAHAGDGIQAVVYDGALRGNHHETIMRDLGLIVVNKVHPHSRNGDQRTWRHIPLGQWTHHPRGRDCTHTLIAHNGNVHDSDLDDSGTLTLSPPLHRKQIRRYPLARGGWRFTLGVHVPCPRGNFTAWISPHRQPGDHTHRRPDQLRLIPDSDPHHHTLYSLRNDSEAINATYKKTLLADRAATLGWQRQTLDLLSWAILNNTLAWWRHRNH